MTKINLICRNCNGSPVHMFRDCQNMYCKCPCVNQLKITSPLDCTCGYMNLVRNPRRGAWPQFFSDDCLCLKPSDHLPDFIRSVPKRITRKGK